MNWKIKVNGTIFITMIFIFVALFIYTFLYNTEDYSDLISAKNGVMEISEEDLQYNIPLKGDWKFYEGKLITSAIGEYEIVTIPHIWNDTGYGTYQLKITGLTVGSCYSLYIYDQLSAFEIYIDSNLIAQNGVVGISEATEEVYWEPLVTKFIAEDSTIDIFIQISNHFHYPGGFIREMKLGTSTNIQNEMKINISNQMILFGGIMMIGLYNLSLFVLNPKESSGGYFAAFNFIVASRVILTGERIINIWFDNLNWKILLKVQFITGASMLALLILFMYSLFKKETTKSFIYTILGILVLFMVAVFIVPMKTLITLDSIFLVIAISYFIYLLAILIRCIKKNVPGSIFSFIGIAFILGSVLLDLVLPPGTMVIPIGIFIFLIFQSLVIAEKYAHIMEQNKILHNVAVRDDMTNLYRKDHFNKIITDILNNDDTLAQHSMMFIDIDNFKSINDDYGHDNGDDVIITIAERILRSLRYSDIACRFGGDEFIVWLHNAKIDEAREVALRILENIIQPIEINDDKVNISVSIGISFYPTDGQTFEKLTIKCDERMYLAKSKGKNQFSVGNES